MPQNTFSKSIQALPINSTYISTYFIKMDLYNTLNKLYISVNIPSQNGFIHSQQNFIWPSTYLPKWIYTLPINSIYFCQHNFSKWIYTPNKLYNLSTYLLQWVYTLPIELYMAINIPFQMTSYTPNKLYISINIHT